MTVQLAFFWPRRVAVDADAVCLCLFCCRRGHQCKGPADKQGQDNDFARSHFCGGKSRCRVPRPNTVLFGCQSIKRWIGTSCAGSVLFVCCRSIKQSIAPLAQVLFCFYACRLIVWSIGTSCAGSVLFFCCRLIKQLIAPLMQVMFCSFCCRLIKPLIAPLTQVLFCFLLPMDRLIKKRSV